MLTLVALSALAGTMRSALFLLASVLSTVAAQIGASWPEAPVEKTEHARMLAAEFGPPSGNDIATYNIILFSSIGLVFIFYFSIMALVNMECEGDSLLYSKSKGD